jgi:hypothetical protein
MHSYKWPAIGIISVTVILLLINQFTETTFIQDYAFLFIIAGMFVGIYLGRISKSKDPN